MHNVSLRTTQNNAAAVPQKASLRLTAVDPDSAGRQVVEAFIAEGFERCYGACIYNFMPSLITLQADKIQACLGVRSATQTLFIEQYLDQPIEQTAPELAIDRQRIVEIGNLVSLSRHATLKLFMNTMLALHRAGYQQLVFCATRKVAAIIQQTGAQLQTIVAADGRRLGASLAQWGSYYDTRPVVMRLCLEAVATLIETSPLLKKQTEGHEADIAQLARHLRVEQ